MHDLCIPEFQYYYLDTVFEVEEIFKNCFDVFQRTFSFADFLKGR